MNLRTVLHQTHLDLGARMTPFGGWDMPVQYSGIIGETKAVRSAAGIFDVSHMGRLDISGPRAGEFLDRMLTASAASLRIGRARYALICNQSGGVIDDTIFYRQAEDRYLLIPNAGNRSAVAAWFQRWIEAEFPDGVVVQDQTDATALIALQGPDSPALLDAFCVLDNGAPAASMAFFSGRWGRFQGKKVFIARTGYTGEDGFELAMATEDALPVWQALTAAGAVPCGLGARDLLRLEAALPLHGHEIDPDTTPIEAGLERFVNPAGNYIGQPALRRQREAGTRRKLVGLNLPGRSAARAGYSIRFQGEEIGKITSGSYSPTLDTSIAMGYVLTPYADLALTLNVDIRGRDVPAEVTPLPFYKRN